MTSKKFTIHYCSKVFENVTRIACSNDNKEKIELDVHDNFFNFFDQKHAQNNFLYSDFNVIITDKPPNAEEVQNISYLMKGYKIGSDLISCHGLLVKYDFIDNENYNYDKKVKLYVIITV